MAKRRQPLVSYLSEPHEVMSIDESETLLDSSLTSSLNVCYPGSGGGEPSLPPPPSSSYNYLRDNSLGSINTQSTTLTGNSKFMSPAVTVVDIDLKARSIDEFDEIQQRTSTAHQRRLRRRKSYDGINEQMSAKTKSSSMLLAIDSSQNVSREGLQPQASGGWRRRDSINYYIITRQKGELTKTIIHVARSHSKLQAPCNCPWTEAQRSGVR